jgi:hypothetical protein
VNGRWDAQRQPCPTEASYTSSDCNAVQIPSDTPEDYSEAERSERKRAGYGKGSLCARDRGEARHHGAKHDTGKYLLQGLRSNRLIASDSVR